MERNNSSRSQSYIDMSSSDEDDDEDYSSGESSETFEDDEDQQQQHRFQVNEDAKYFCAAQDNLFNKLIKREYLGNTNFSHKTLPLLNSVPTRLSFCLKDVIPQNFLQGQVFMGLSACGQFMLSYKVCSNDNANVSSYSFTIGYKYSLFFWVYQPHKPLRTFYKSHLFDDHGVDNLKDVTMVQWKNCDPRILVVHGAAEDETEDSYITYVKVPKLGCLDCKKLRDSEADEGYFRRYVLCLKCNLTVHTKYATTETDRKFDPYINLICPDRILIISNGYFHVLRIFIEQTPKEQQSQQQTPSHSQTPLSILMLKPISSSQGSTGGAAGAAIAANSGTPDLNNMQQEKRSTPVQFNLTDDNFSLDSPANHIQNTIVARIIEDFDDIETMSTHSGSSVIAAAAASSSSSQTQHNLMLKSPSYAGDSQSSQLSMIRKSCEEFIFTCTPKSNATSRSSAMSPAAAAIKSNACSSTTKTSPTNVAAPSAIKNSPLPRPKHRIVSKSFRNGVTKFFSGFSLTANTSPTSAASANAGASVNSDKAAAYEFSEENEKCEKISILRKRRLADRKYEFSEDNSENIIPFTKTRTSTHTFFSNSTKGSNSPRHNLTTTHHHLHSVPSPYASPSSSPHPYNSTQCSPAQYHCTPTQLSAAAGAGNNTAAMSPISHHSCSSPLGFRSPPSTSGFVSAATGGAGVSGSFSFMRSPSRHLTTNQLCNQQKSPPHHYFPHVLSAATQHMLSFKPHGGHSLSPLQLSMTKRSHMDVGVMVVGSMSPNHQMPFLSPRRDIIEMPTQGGTFEKPVCSKKFLRRFVEEDDAASVITSEEDDCISPGYHTLLPVEVHGSCYSEMQMISKLSYQQLRCTSVVIEQHSMDMETFTYYVISTLCHKNQKTYDLFYDWAYELINVCTDSHTIFCLLMAQFSAREEFASCINCSRKLYCAFHRRKYECRVLFTWNMISGEWDVLDFGELHDCNHSNFIGPLKKDTFAASAARTPNNVVSLSQKAKKLAKDMAQTLSKMPDYTQNLRVLDSNVKKSKKTIVDADNMVEFYLKRPSSYRSMEI